MFNPSATLSPELKKLRSAIIDAIDSCNEADDEAVWMELLSFLPEWRLNLQRAGMAKINHAFIRAAHPNCQACQRCGEVLRHQVHGVREDDHRSS